MAKKDFKNRNKEETKEIKEDLREEVYNEKASKNGTSNEKASSSETSKNEASNDETSNNEGAENETSNNKVSSDENPENEVSNDGGSGDEASNNGTSNLDEDGSQGGDSEQVKDKKDQKIDELTDRYLRLMAEFDNYRKRTEKEKSKMFEIGAKDIIEKMLPVIDNFERGLAAATDEEKGTAFVTGVEKIYKQLITSLEGAGVKAIEAVGQEFNPDYHNAVMHTEDPDVGENIIVEELQKGYIYRDTVVRHSMVKVAN